MRHLRNHFFDDSEYLDEFADFLKTVVWSDRSPLNTEMLFLWSMIRSTKPQLFIESGTFKGYSADFICEALTHNHNDAEFTTYGFNLEDCIPFARERLARHPFARVIEGDSRVMLRDRPRETRATAFFIDGPKGKNLPPLLFNILARFPNVLFIAIHDCQRESGSRNREYLEGFFGWEFPVMYCDADFQDKFRYLDEPLVGKSQLVDWKPYHWNGARQASYGTETGYVLPVLGRIGTPVSRAFRRLYRQLRFNVYHRLWLLYVDIRTR